MNVSVIATVTTESNVASTSHQEGDEASNGCGSCVQLFQDSSSDSADSFDGVLSSPITPQFSPVLTASDAAESSGSEDFFDFLQSQLSIQTFKLVADNLDFYIRPRQETMDHHAYCLHCTHVMAVKDRVDCSELSDIPRSVDLESVNFEAVLPSDNDLIDLKENLTVLLCRIVRTHMPFFSKHINAKTFPQHIQHQFSSEMSSKSEVVRKYG